MNEIEKLGIFIIVSGLTAMNIPFNVITLALFLFGGVLFILGNRAFHNKENNKESQ